MRFKLDENLDTRLAPILTEHGHDVATVLGQHLGGRPDEMIYRTCVAEKRALITLDLDFSNPIRFQSRIQSASSFCARHDRCWD
jgi:predicted nuclease of predicted toxin-antitoxin system